jgi:hypothetical protein
MDPYPFHYARRPKFGDLMDPSVCLMLDEHQQMEARLGDRIDGQCCSLERCVEEVEQKIEERLISLEMSHMEVEMGHADLAKQFDSLKSEVICLNRFIKRGTLVKEQGQPGIFTAAEPTHAESSTGHRVEPRYRNPEFGLNPPRSQALVHGMINPKSIMLWTWRSSHVRLVCVRQSLRWI